MPANILKGRGYVISEEVKTDGPFYKFEIKSDFGIYRVTSREMLDVRLYEIGVLNEAQNISGMGEFGKSLKDSIVQVPVSASKLITQPVQSVKNIGKSIKNKFLGVGRFFSSGRKKSKYELSGKALAKCVDASLEFVSLADRRKDLVKNYSGGMKRRLNIAVALIHEPRIVLLDEPTVGVDPQSRNAIFDNILELKARGVTIVYTTHYMEEAEKLCDRVAIMDNGKILALDSLPSLIKAHGGQSVVVLEGQDGEERIETDHPLDELVKRQGETDFASFRVERPDLERVFLNLTGRHLRD